MCRDLKGLCRSQLELKSKCKGVGSLLKASSLAVRNLRRMGVGKECQTTINYEFTSSNPISLYLFFFCLNLWCLKKKIRNPIHSSFLIVFSIIISLYFLYNFFELHLKKRTYLKHVLTISNFDLNIAKIQTLIRPNGWKLSVTLGFFPFHSISKRVKLESKAKFAHIEKKMRH